jgi:hypothetical protein
MLIKLGDKSQELPQLIQYLSMFFNHQLPIKYKYDEEIAYWVLMFQLKNFLTADGIIGNKTISRLKLVTSNNKYGILDASGNIKPRYLLPHYSQRQMEAAWGNPGDTSKHERFTLPYDMKLSWDTKTTVSSITMNKDCGLRLMLALDICLKHYGIAKISKMRLDHFGGSYNLRRMRGGSEWSSHAYAASIDINTLGNPFRARPIKTDIVKAEYEFFCNTMVKQGFKTLEFDLMHWQSVIDL